MQSITNTQNTNGCHDRLQKKNACLAFSRLYCFHCLSYYFCPLSVT